MQTQQQEPVTITTLLSNSVTLPSGEVIQQVTITEPGIYVEKETGDAWRMEATTPFALSKQSSEPIELVKVSNDPHLPNSQLRLLAAQADLEVNF